MGYQRWTSFMVIAILVSVWRSGYIAGKSVRSGSFTSRITAACPLNQTEFSEASQRMNCTGNTRYLCAPNANLSALVEFCSVAPRFPFGPDNCVTLQSNGYLNHVSCNSTFENGCPDTIYFDDEIFKFPKCLMIDLVQRCFLADRSCKYVQSTTSFDLQNSTIDDSNHTSSPRDENRQRGTSGLFRLVGLPAAIPVIVLLVLSLILCCSDRGVKGHSSSEEHGRLLPRKTGKTGANEDYLRQYLNKKIEVRHARCIILGCGGAGKSTLLARLQDKPYKEIKKIESTQGLDVHVNIFEVLEETIQCVPYEKKETPGMSNIVFSALDDIEDVEDNACSNSQKEVTPGIENGEENKNLLDNIDDNHSKNEASFRRMEDANFAENVMYQDQENTVHIHTRKETVDEHVTKHENVDTKEDDKNYEMKEIFDAVTQLVKDKPRKPRITFLDFAGQDDYYAFHQIYLSPRTVYILVVDMSKPFDSVNEFKENYGSRFASWNLKDCYKFWLKSIDSFSDTEAPVIVVGTHAEEKKEEDCENFFKEFFELFDSRHDLQRHLHRKRRFAIKFPVKGSKLENLSEIKKCISSLVQKLPYWRENMRLSWAIFEQILEREKTSKRRKIITRAELLEYNQALEEEFRMEEENLTTMLLFLNRVGAILFIDEKNLRNTIILNVKWFVEAFTCIITHSVNMDEPNDQQNKRFHDIGELQDTELDAIWRANPDHDFIDNKDKLITFMEQLGLLAVCDSRSSPTAENGTWYYFPSMNRRKFEGIQMHRKSSILCFQFDKKGQLPIFLFYHLVSKCFKLPEWSILKEGEERCIYDRVACFCFQNHIVAICICKFQIQAQVLVPNDSAVPNYSIDPNILKKVQTSLEDTIEEVFKRRKELTKHTYSVGYKCQQVALNNEEDNSFINQTSFPLDNPFCCETCKIGKKHYIGNNICWNIGFSGYDELNDIGFKQEAETARKTLRKTRTESEGPNMEFGVDDVKLLESIQRACSLGNKQKFDHELQKLRTQKEILFTLDLSGCSLLHFACEGGDLAIVQILIDEGFELNPAFNGKTVLHIASKHGHIAVCDYVLSKNPELLKITDHLGGNSAHYAAEGGHTEILKYLLKKGIDPEQLTKTKRNILHIAASNDQHDLCKHILQKYPKLLNSVDFQGWNALHFAASQGHVEIFDILESKVDVKAKSTLGDTVLHIACLKRRQEMCKRIMKTCPELIKEKNTLGRTPIFSAAEGGDIAILKLLRYHNADEEANAADSHTLLHVASEHSHYEICEYLVERFPGMTNQLTKKGWNALHMLAAGPTKTDDDEIMVFNLLVNHDLNIHQTTKNGSSILKLACKNIKYKLCKFMIEKHPTLLKIPNVDHLKTAEETKNEDMIELFKTYCHQI